jgi:hypothetical protein
MADPPPNQSALSKLEKPDLIKSASRIAGFDLGARPTFGSAANISGVRTKTLVFSRRRDSLTIFARDETYGYARKAGAWTGPDKNLVARTHKILRAARIPDAEIRRIRVVSERGTVAERLKSGEFRVERPELLRKLARAERRVTGVPVWSSHAVVGLTQKGAIGFLEIHWPELRPDVLAEAKVLASLVKAGFEHEELRGAEIESVEAGVIHSPAIGFFMDAVPVIRCVYRANETRLGTKPLVYLDRHGERVSLPRGIEAAPPVEGDRPR